jgi:hypothetical protein
MPEFKEREPGIRERKMDRIQPILDKGMARKQDTAPALPDGYSFPAMPKAMMRASGNKDGEAFLDKFADARASGNRDGALGILGQ